VGYPNKKPKSNTVVPITRREWVFFQFQKN